MGRFRYSVRILYWGNRMRNKYRLSSNAFDREREEDKVSPQKIFFLSAEGNNTEKEYFDGISAHRQVLGINALVNVEVLKRSRNDTLSAPQHVVELLEEYLQLRENGEETFSNDIPEELIEKYGVEFIETFLEDSESLTRKQRNEFNTELRKIGYDILYRKYLNSHREELDEFGILIDRDSGSHSEEEMLQCIQHCIDNGYNCYISNPCFEFWLLLHLSDIKEEYAGRMDELKRNETVSSKHTFISKELSEKAHHGKSGIAFKEKYLPYVDTAVERAKEFAGEELELVDNIGSNIYKLIEDMKRYGK